VQDLPEGISGVSQPAKRGRFRGACVTFFRWAFIVLFAVILLGGLYFKAPWKILALDAILLALLTVVPKSLRKYGWLTLAAAALAVTVWIFLPEKDSGNWNLYTFDKELAELEAQRSVPAQDDAAPLYEALFEQWKQIEQADPFPEKADECGQTIDRPWTASEFPEVAAWLDRHKDFFQDVMTAAQKPNCYFSAAVTTFDLSKDMEQLSLVKKHAQHLVRASQLDIGEHRTGAWQKQVAVLCLGKHMNQQPLMIDVLVGIAIESMARAAILETLMDTDELKNLSPEDYQVIVRQIQTSHFDIQMKLQQSLAYEKLFTKNFFGMFYETNSAGKIRFSRLKSLINVINETSPNEKISDLQASYWKSVAWKYSRVTFRLLGLPKDPVIISGWVDDVYGPFKEGIKTGTDGFPKDTQPFELNYNYLIYQLSQIVRPSFEKIDKILNQVQTKKNGAELVCDLVNYKRQHGQFPDTLEQLEMLTVSAESCKGFVYQKTENSFILYNIGPNNLDEKGVYRMSEYDPNEGLDGFLDMKVEADDVLIWPKELDASAESQ
jgi:hypothetical protein